MCFFKQRHLQLSSMQVAEYARALCAEPHDASVTADAVTQSRLLAACDSALYTRFILGLMFMHKACRRRHAHVCANGMLVISHFELQLFDMRMPGGL